jgi:hypothetical protein
MQRTPIVRPEPKQQAENPEPANDSQSDIRNDLNEV